MRDESESSRPAFARDFPRTPEIDSLVAAFTRGDYAAVRDEAPKLLASPNEDVARAARSLRDRTSPDRVTVTIFAMTAVMLLVVSWYWIVHGHSP